MPYTNERLPILPILHSLIPITRTFFIYIGYLPSTLHPTFPFRNLPTSSTSPCLSSLGEAFKTPLDYQWLTIRYIGCYTDTTAKRAFAHELTDSIPGGAANMTVANCARAANVTGYVLFGIEYRYIRPLTSRREKADRQSRMLGRLEPRPFFYASEQCFLFHAMQRKQFGILR
jgi:hypothetical protein